MLFILYSDSRGRDVGVVGENREVSYSCCVEPSYIGCAANLLFLKHALAPCSFINMD